MELWQAEITEDALAELAGRYERVRRQSERLCEPLQVEDFSLQTMLLVSPPKWHLAHTSWFFDTFVLAPFNPGYRPFHPLFGHLFNSYYETVGRPFERSKRGLLSRPSTAEVFAYRAHVDEAVLQLLRSEVAKEELAWRITLGLNHEQQHQELLLTDIKFNFFVNPLKPTYWKPAAQVSEVPQAPLGWQRFEGGVQEIGHPGGEFGFDNETPRHRVRLEPFSLADRLVTNGEYLRFMADGGYQRSELWLSDGWAAVQKEGWQAPLYWEQSGEPGEASWWLFTLGGMRPVTLADPVTHVSYYEADAYARWYGKRLPTEQEWEVAASSVEVKGNFADSGRLHPAPADGHQCTAQLFGDAWEWTASPYMAYPGYRREEGPFGEYNGKFMCNQLVLRGGSCATPAGHIRPSYRNFFYPIDRWQFSGIRLAQ